MYDRCMAGVVSGCVVWGCSEGVYMGQTGDEPVTVLAASVLPPPESLIHEVTAVSVLYRVVGVGVVRWV